MVTLVETLNWNGGAVTAQAPPALSGPSLVAPGITGSTPLTWSLTSKYTLLRTQHKTTSKSPITWLEHRVPGGGMVRWMMDLLCSVSLKGDTGL